MTFIKYINDDANHIHNQVYFNYAGVKHIFIKIITAFYNCRNPE